MGETVNIIRREFGLSDDYGNPSEITSVISVAGCLFGFGSTNEPSVVDSEPQASQATIYFPAGTVIEESDSFVARGSSWVKDGRHMDWVSPHGEHQGVVVNVRQHLG